MFDLHQMQNLLMTQVPHMKRLIAAWGNRDLGAVEEELAHFHIDYIAAESSEALWLKERDGTWSYLVETSLGNFIIFRRRDLPPPTEIAIHASL